MTQHHMMIHGHKELVEKCEHIYIRIIYINQCIALIEFKMLFRT